MVLSLGSGSAYATTDQYYCTPHPESTTYCCDPEVETCSSDQISFDSNSNLGKHELGGDVTIYLQLQCNNDGTLESYNYGHSGGSIKCTAAGGGAGIGSNYIKLMCANSSSDSGHAWIEQAECSSNQATG